MSKLYQIRILFNDRPPILSAPLSEQEAAELIPAIGREDVNNLHFMLHQSTTLAVIPTALLRSAIVYFDEYNEEDDTDE